MLVDALAAYRLTRLVTADVITEKLRDAFVREQYARRAGAEVDTASPVGLPWAQFAEHDGNAPKLATLVTCRWCAGMWISFGVIAARRLTPRLWDPIAKALACSAAAALIARLEDDT
jgi:hypothetical protein